MTELKSPEKYIETIRRNNDHYADQDFIEEDIIKMIKQIQADAVEVTTYILLNEHKEEKE